MVTKSGVCATERARVGSVPSMEKLWIAGGRIPRRENEFRDIPRKALSYLVIPCDDDQQISRLEEFRVQGFGSLPQGQGHSTLFRCFDSEISRSEVSRSIWLHMANKTKNFHGKSLT